MTPLQWAIQIGGGILVTVTLADLFLTVLFARGSVGVFTPALNRVGWRLGRGFARLLGPAEPKVLALLGPTLLALTAVNWALLLIVGFGGMLLPELGDGLRASGGPTSTSFSTALYFSGYAFTTVGNGDLVPHSTFVRLLLVAEGGIGFATITLALTYFVSVLAALANRNAFALRLFHASGDTGDPVALLKRLGPGGEFGASAQAEMSDIAGSLAKLTQDHHAYAALHYFRWPQAEYAMARILLQCLDTVALARTLLDSGRHSAFTEGAGAEGVWRAGHRLLRDAQADFLPRGADAAAMSADRLAFLEARLWVARSELQRQGFKVTAAPDIDRYLEDRSVWEPAVRAFARYMAYEWTAVAPDEPTLLRREPASSASSAEKRSGAAADLVENE